MLSIVAVLLIVLSVYLVADFFPQTSCFLFNFNPFLSFPYTSTFQRKAVDIKHNPHSQAGPCAI